MRYLADLTVRMSDEPQPSILLGDFNQTLPPTRQPAAVYEQLETLLSGMVLATRGLAHDGEHAIDHIAHLPAFRCRQLTTLPRLGNDTVRRSDHFGILAELERAT